MSEWVRKGIVKDGRLRTSEEKIIHPAGLQDRERWCTECRTKGHLFPWDLPVHPTGEGRHTKVSPRRWLGLLCQSMSSQDINWKVLPPPSAVHCLNWFPQAWFSLIYLDRKIFGFLPLTATALLLAPIWRSPLAWKLDILLTGKNTRFGCLCKWSKNPPTSQY